MDTLTKARSRAWTIAGIAAGICAFAFLIGIQPSYLLYAFGGVLIGIAVRWWIGLLVPWRGRASLGDALLTLLGVVFVFASGTILASIIGTNKTLTVMAVAVVVLGMLGAAGKLKMREFLRALGWLFIPLCLVAFFVSISSLLLVSRYGGPRPVKVQYLGNGSIRDRHWVLTHILVVDTQSYESVLDVSPSQDTALVKTMEECGWKEEIEGTFSLVSDQPVNSKWFPFKTVNTLKFPSMRCGDMIFSTLSDSTLTLTVPEYEIAKTDPEATTRSEGLEGGEEKIIIPVQFHWKAPPTVQAQTISPLLQNRVGSLLLKVDLWAPLRWAIFVMCAIFGNQIREKCFVPAARWTFKKLGLKFEEGDDESLEQKDEETEDPEKRGGPNVIW